MGLLDKLFGSDDAVHARPAQRSAEGDSAQSADERALAQYRYMLKTAPPETIEQAHTEAFARLGPEQRSKLLQQLTADLPAAERSGGGGVSNRDDPQSLARLATRAEVRAPGSMERTLGGVGGRGMGMGGLMAGSFLSTIAGVVVGSAIAQSFFGDSHAGASTDAHGTSDDVAGDTSADAGSDAGGDFDGGGDFS